MKTRNKRIKNYKEGGITLIALVVTVIILLILAGVTISLVVGQNGLLQRAQTASNTMANATANELTQLGQYDSDVETYTKEFIDNNSSTRATIPAGTYTPAQEIVYNGNSFDVLTVANASDGEHFFVLGDDGNKVRLLAKYCVNPSPIVNEQMDKTANPDDYGLTFSSINYWSEETIPTDSVSNRSVLELQGEFLEEHPLSSAETVSNNAIKKAEAYGDAIGAEGRLMTFEEAWNIGEGTTTKMQRILYGKWTEEDIGASETDAPIIGYLQMWIGAALHKTAVASTYGYSVNIGYTPHNDPYRGVRPVLIVPEA